MEAKMLRKTDNQVPIFTGVFTFNSKQPMMFGKGMNSRNENNGWQAKPEIYSFFFFVSAARQPCKF